MCSKGGGSPPVPSAASTTFNSTTSPNPTVAPLYTDFLNRAQTLSNTPFNPAMQGSVAPLNTEQQAAGGQLFSLGMDMGNFDPAKVQSMMSPFTESVVDATQNWFNNQNAIQGNDLISGAIRSGNAFGGDRAGVAQGVLAGQQQLAQAPVIAGLRQAGYTQALDEYNRLKQFGIQGAGAAMGWGGLEQQQSQRELDVAQQNAMMSSAYPFQTLNWYGSALGGIGPLMGQTAAGSNNPPDPNSLSQAIGIGSSAIGLGSAALGAFGSPTAASSTTDAGSRAWRGGSIHRARGGLVDLPRGFAYGGDPSALSSDDSDDQDKYRSSDSNREEEPAPSKSDQPSLPPQHRVTRPDFGFGHLNLGNRQLPQPVFPSSSGSSSQPQKSDASQLLDFGAKVIPLVAKAAPFFIQRGGGVGHFAYGGDTDDGEIMDDSGPPSYPAGAQLADTSGRMTWFNPRPYSYTDPETGQIWNDTGARSLREGAHASGLPISTPGFATAGSRGLGHWYEATLPDGRKYTVQKTDVGPRGVVDLNAALASQAYPGGPRTVPGGRASVSYLGPNRPDSATSPAGPNWPDPNQGDANVSGLPSGEQPSTPGWQVPGARQGRSPPAATGPMRDPDEGAQYGRGQGDLRPGESRTIPGMARPEQTFAQRWASNPFTQLGANLLAQRSPYFGVNLGKAMQGTMEAQNLSRRQDILDAKPEMMEHNGRILFRIGDKVTDMGLATNTDETRKAAAAARPYGVERETPGRFGTTTKSKEYYTDEPGGGRKPFESPVQPEQTGQQPRVIPEEQPPAQSLPPPQQPPAQQPPAQQQPPPQIRQTQAPPAQGGGTGTLAGDLQRPLEERLAAAEVAEAGTTAPPTTPTPAPTQQAQAPQRAPAQVAVGPGAGGIEQVENDWKTGRVPPAGTMTNPAARASRNEAALEGLSPADQRIIKGIADYTLDPNRVFAGQNSKLRLPAMEYVAAYDPNYNQAMYATRAAALKNYHATGPEARVIQSQDMVMQHIGEGMDSAEKLAPYLHGYSWMNKAQTAQQEAFLRDPKRQAALQAVEAKYDAIATEAMRVFRGGVGAGSQKEIQEWRKTISASDPIEKQRIALKAITRLVYGRVDATARRYNDSMGPAYERAPESWLGPKAQDAMRRASDMPDDGSQPFGARQRGPSEGGGMQLSGQDQQALDWANSNPNDPRAGQIKQRLGVQ